MGATLPYDVWAHCFSCWGAEDLGPRASVIVAFGLQSTGSVIVTQGLSCSAARGIFMDQGSKPHPLYWWEDSYSLSPGKSFDLFCFVFRFHMK